MRAAYGIGHHGNLDLGIGRGYQLRVNRIAQRAGVHRYDALRFRHKQLSALADAVRHPTPRRCDECLGAERHGIDTHELDREPHSVHRLTAKRVMTPWESDSTASTMYDTPSKIARSRCKMAG